MTALYIASIAAAAGKTALSAALGHRLLEQGKRVGFLKPVLITSEETQAIDKDAEFIKQVLALEEPAESLCPVVLSPEDLDAALSSKEDAFSPKIQAAYNEASRNKDVVILEGLSGFTAGSKLGLASGQIAALVDAKAVLVIRYAPDLTPEDIAASGKLLPDRLVGVIINAVPQSQTQLVKTSLVPFLEGNGIKVLGVLPEDRLLFAASAGQIADHLQGEVLNSNERLDELVENVMIGAMTVDSALEYFSLKPNKAVITRSDRPDIQRAALETSTRCLVLTGNTHPIPGILYRAEEKSVPMILVKDDTLATASVLEEVFSTARFHQEKKLERMGEILDEHFDWARLYSALGFG